MKTAENCSFLSAEWPSAAAQDTSAAALRDKRCGAEDQRWSSDPGRVGPDFGSGQARKIK